MKNQTNNRTAIWIALARGWSLFLGLYFLANLVGTFSRAHFDSVEWILNFAGFPAAFEAFVTASAAIALIAFALSPQTKFARSRFARLLVVSALLVSLINVAQFYRLLASGWISCVLPIPLSLFTATILGVIVWSMRQAREVPQTHRVTLLTALSFGSAIIVFPVAQMLFFGTTDYSRHADAIVVFGARTYKDGRPSDALKDRVRTACELYKAGLAPVIVMSGGPGEGATHETEAMRNYALLHGVPAQAILLDPNGLNTAATLRNLDQLARAHHWQRILAVSHAYHLPRVKLSGCRHGLNLYTVPARSPQFLAKLPLFIARETTAWWVYFLKEP